MARNLVMKEPVSTVGKDIATCTARHCEGAEEGNYKCSRYGCMAIHCKGAEERTSQFVR
jgi:hypothetical protein